MLQGLLARAATSDKTVIITTLNKAWAANNTMIDLYLESFHRGENTKQLLKHLVIVALDQTAYDRCRELHQHCFMLKTDGVDFAAVKPFMSEDFLKMMWRRMQFLKMLLEMGYSFVFSVRDWKFCHCSFLPSIVYLIGSDRKGRLSKYPRLPTGNWVGFVQQDFFHSDRLGQFNLQACQGVGIQIF